MTAMKITRRIIDPITFVERVGIEFIPRIEDSALDDQLAGSMSYAPPKSGSLRTQPPPPPPSDSSPPPPVAPDAIRPPTPPKQRGKLNPNSPRNSITSPGSKKPKIKSSMKLSTHFSSQQGRSKRASVTLAQIGEERADYNEEEDASEGSMSHLSALQTSVTKVEAAEFKAKTITKTVRFTDEVEMKEISRLRNSVIAEMFWASEDLANFRYEAFMEEAGLDINEFG